MKRLLYIELLKTLNYPTFKTLLALYTRLFLLVIFVATSINLNIQGINIERLFQTPHIWDTFAWLGKWFNLLLGILVVLLVTNEFQFRTFRKQLIDGLARNELIAGKILIVATIGLYSTLVVFVSGLIFAISNSSSFGPSDLLDGLATAPRLYLQTLAFTLMAMLFAFLFRNAALSIVSYILFFFPLEPIIRALLPDAWDGFMPIKAMSSLTPMPDIVGIAFGDALLDQGSASSALQAPPPDGLSLLPMAAITLGYSALFIIISNFMVQRRNF